MFTIYHFIWLVVCSAIIVPAIVILNRKKPSIKKVLTAACAVCVCSEVVKTFGVIRMVYSSDGSMAFPYLELQHLPLHLCSLQIAFIFYARFAKAGKVKNVLLAFMYPTCVIGATCALLIPSILSTTIKPYQAFTHPMGYQFFLYHAMLIIVGAYIPLSKQVDIRPKNYFSTIGILSLLAFSSLYFNSIFAAPTYENGKLTAVEHTPNFFFTELNPLGIKLTELWQWYIYLICIVCVAMISIGLLYLPILIAKRKDIPNRIDNR